MWIHETRSIRSFLKYLSCETDTIDLLGIMSMRNNYSNIKNVSSRFILDNDSQGITVSTDSLKRLTAVVNELIRDKVTPSSISKEACDALDALQDMCVNMCIKLIWSYIENTKYCIFDNYEEIMSSYMNILSKSQTDATYVSDDTHDTDIPYAFLCSDDMIANGIDQESNDVSTLESNKIYIHNNDISICEQKEFKPAFVIEYDNSYDAQKALMILIAGYVRVMLLVVHNFNIPDEAISSYLTRSYPCDCTRLLCHVYTLGSINRIYDKVNVLFTNSILYSLGLLSYTKFKRNIFIEYDTLITEYVNLIKERS